MSVVSVSMSFCLQCGAHGFQSVKLDPRKAKCSLSSALIQLRLWSSHCNWHASTIFFLIHLEPTIAHTAECKLRLVDLVGSEEHPLVAIMSNVKFCQQHSRARSLRGVVTSCFWPRSGLFFDIGRPEFIERMRDDYFRNHCLSVQRVLTRRTYIMKILRDYTFLAKLEGIDIWKQREVSSHSYKREWDKVRRRRVRKCMTEERLVETAAFSSVSAE